jgi:hypothetical protein
MTRHQPPPVTEPVQSSAVAIADSGAVVGLDQSWDEGLGLATEVTPPLTANARTRIDTLQVQPEVNARPVQAPQPIQAAPAPDNADLSFHSAGVALPELAPRSVYPAPGDDLADFHANLTRTRLNLVDLQDELSNAEDAVSYAKQALELPGQIEAQATKFLASVKSAKFSLKIADKVGPLKVVAKALDVALSRVESISTSIRDKAREIDRKVRESGAIEKLERAEDKLQDIQLDLFAIELKVGDYEDTVGNVIFGLDLVGEAADPFRSAADSVVTPLNVVLDSVNGTYETLQGALDDLRGNFTSSLFSGMVSVGSLFGKINATLAPLASPLNAVYKALKPVEWLLDAAGFLYGITVGPVVDWLLDSLGITRVFDAAAKKLTSFLPSPTILNALASGIDAAFDRIDGFLDTDGWTTSIDDILDDLSANLVPGLASDAPGTFRIGTDGNDTLQGRDGVNDILDPRGGDDVVYGGSGNDVIMSSKGHDTVFGGAGTDWLVLQAPLFEFTLAVPVAGGAVTWRHSSGRIEVAHDVEYFVFTDITVPRSDVGANFIIPSGPLLIGTEDDDKIYGSSVALEIRGLGGNDNIFATPQPIRSLAATATM